MADTKEGREKQARTAEKRQREREIREARERSDEVEPPSEVLDDADSPPECHRRGCTEPASFVVLERYQEETGQGAVEARAFLCREHTAEESPVNLDRAYPDYVFRVDPLPGTTEET
ncbi:MAG: hypothetical protein V5A62_16330 [Haloarculaceae archaeon]